MALAESVSEGVAICHNGKVHWANSVLAERMGRCSAQSLEGRDFQDFFVDIGKGVPDGSSWRHVECGLRVAEAGSRRVRLQRMELSDFESTELWVVADADEKNSAGTDREVAELREQLEVESRSREELISFVSHELRTPLTLIQGYNRLLLGSSESMFSDPQVGFLNESARNCSRMSAILDRLSEEAGGGTSPCDAVRLEWACLGTTLRSAIDRVSPIFEKLDMRVEIGADFGDLRFQFDPSRIEQVFVNVLENAAKYAGSSGSIGVSSRLVDGLRSKFVEISLSDKGPGIAEKDRERVFESGVRLFSGNFKPGSGLGLYISRRIVRAHGGHMIVVGNPKGGSTFVFTLPLQVADID